MNKQNAKPLYAPHPDDAHILSSCTNAKPSPRLPCHSETDPLCFKPVEFMAGVGMAVLEGLEFMQVFVSLAQLDN